MPKPVDKKEKGKVSARAFSGLFYKAQIDGINTTLAN
jgi:hypothetical protein